MRKRRDSIVSFLRIHQRPYHSSLPDNVRPCHCASLIFSFVVLPVVNSDLTGKAICVAGTLSALEAHTVQALRMLIVFRLRSRPEVDGLVNSAC